MLTIINMRQWIYAGFFAFILLYQCSARAETVSDSEATRPEKLVTMLSLATENENQASPDSYWRAAAIYCKAARLGDLEAQYRLGMLYAFGKGVPQSNVYAATLFAFASRQGHRESMNMLETINFQSDSPPPCVLSDVDPEKLPQARSFAYDGDNAKDKIDDYLNDLPNEKKWILDLVRQTAEWNGVDPKLVFSIIAIESGFELRAKSSAKAMGLMQLIPATADRFNVKNAFDAVQNIKGGIRYLSWLINYYRGNVDLAVAAYNAGEGAVDRYKGIPPFAETRLYLKKLRMLYKRDYHPYKDNLSRTTPISTSN